MKKKIFTLFAVPMVLVGLGSCNKTVSEFDSTNGETGALKLNVTFASTGLTKATVTDNTMRPTSTWADVESLMLLVCNSTTNTVVARTEVPVEEFTQTGTSGSYYFTNIPVGSDYNVYAIANYTTDATTAWTNGYGGLPASSYELPQANTTPTYSLGIADYTRYNEGTYTVPGISELFSTANAATLYSVCSAAPNYFVGTTTVQEISALQATEATVSLERPVNLVRVKVKLSGANVDEATNNPKITFATNASSMVLRRVNTTYNFVSKTYAFTEDAPEYNASFAPGPFTELPLAGVPTGYTGATITAGDYIWYKDMLAFPPTNYADADLTNARQNFNDPNPNQLHLSLYAIVADDVTDYEDSDGVTVDPGTVVSFSADVDLTNEADAARIYEGNVIITLNVELKSNGRTGGEPTVGQNGNMNVTVTLSDWEYEVSTDITI